MIRMFSFGLIFIIVSLFSCNGICEEIREPLFKEQSYGYLFDGNKLEFKISNDLVFISWNIKSLKLPVDLLIKEENQEWQKLTKIDSQVGSFVYVSSIKTEEIKIALTYPMNVENKTISSFLTDKNLFEENFKLPPEDIKLKSASDYIEKVLPWAREENGIYGTPVSISIAQSALETGWGTSLLSQNYNNYFGLTSLWGIGSPYKKEGTVKIGNEEFNVYSAPIYSFLDHGWGLKNYSRYQNIWNYTNDPDRFIKEVRKAGYAEDEMYAAKIIKIMQNYNLYKYDIPPTISTNFKPGDYVITTDFLYIRETPAGKQITLLSPESKGRILESPYNCICKELNGKNWIWWYVEMINSYDGEKYIGWCSEHRLILDLKGDINLDGVVDISDVILCLRMAIGLDPVDKNLADMNNDGLVDISDVILILRKAVGLD